MDTDDLYLMYQALQGDEDATRIYCGSYTLVRNNKTLQLYRVRGDVPDGYTKVELVYDKDGFLMSRYWSYPRIGIDV